MNDYTRHINFIAETLDELKIPYSKNDCWGGLQLRFPWCEGDIICHQYSMGSDAGFVESYCFPWDEDDVTMLSPQEAIEKIFEYYQKIS